MLTFLGVTMNYKQIMIISMISKLIIVYLILYCLLYAGCKLILDTMLHEVLHEVTWKGVCNNWSIFEFLRHKHDSNCYDKLLWVEYTLSLVEWSFVFHENICCITTFKHFTSNSI